MITFSNRLFECTHGQRPRGAGDWYFEAKSTGRGDFLVGPFHGTLTQAKAAARRALKGSGHDNITLEVSP